MPVTSYRRLILLCAALSVAAPVFAQQSSSAPPTSSTAAATPNSSAAKSTAKVLSAPDVPNAEVLKKARTAGYHTKVSHNVVLYCKTDTDIGTRFPSEKCLNENELLEQLQLAQAQRDQLTGHTCGGAGCSGK